MRRVGPSSGRVMWRSVVQLVAPSIAAASCSSRGMPCSPGEEEDDREADVLPRDHDEERVEDEPEVGEPQVDEAAEPDERRTVDEPVRLEDLKEHDRGDRLREHVRREEDQAEESAAAQRPVEEERHAEGERQLEAQRQRDKDPVVVNRLAEPRVAERLAVVVQADEVGERPEAVPEVEAVTNRLDDRDDDEEGVERRRRREYRPIWSHLRPRRRTAGREIRGRPSSCRSAPDVLRTPFLTSSCRRRDLLTTCGGVALPAN